MSSKYEIIIVVDENDGNYRTSILEVDKKIIDQLEPLFKAIRNFRDYKSEHNGLSLTWHHNYPNGTFSPRTSLGEKTIREIYPDIPESLFELFEELCPDCPDGFHTVKSVRVGEIVSRKVLV